MHHVFLGSKERYAAFSQQNVGTYLYSPGWIERDIDPADVTDGITTQLGMNKSYEAYVEEFGEENAEYIMEMLGGYEQSYSKVAFINTKVGNIAYYRKKLKEKAESVNWIPAEIEGDNALLLRFLNGDWDENDFAVILPQHKIVATYDDDIIGHASAAF